MKIIYRLVIGFYQKFISPKKGFRCAYSVAHGGPGCSGAVLGILEGKGLIRGWASIQTRFHDCHQAAVDLTKKKQDDEDEKKKKKKKSGNEQTSNCNGWGDVCAPASCDVADCAVWAIRPKKCVPDIPSCDVPSCDCGGVSIMAGARDVFRRRH